MLLNRHLLATLAYYDVLNFPMAAVEVWRHLIRWEGNGTDQLSFPVPLGAVVAGLDGLVREGRLETERGFYVLPGRVGLVSERLSRMRASLPRIRGARRLARLLRFVPFVRMVFLTGSLAMKNGDRESDWDLLLVLRGGHIWMGRLVTVLLLQLLGKRRHGPHVRDRACLNHWITDRTLTIGLHDLFSAHEYSWAVPLYATSGYGRFLHANGWISRFQPHYESEPLPPRWCLSDGRIAGIIRGIGEILLGDPALERLAGRLQRSKIRRNPKSTWPGSYIVADDSALVFLPKPQGPRVFDRYQRRLQDVLLPPAEPA